ncbi:MAG: resolvase, partial [Oscillospiraceae bacterium]|nr:resolvase [Oscillospiraceae bacterium]
SGNEQENKKAAQEKALRDATNRISFIEDASKRLFEEKISGNVPDSLFKKMFSDYERELGELEAKTADLRRCVGEAASGKADVMRWMGLVKECASIDRLDRSTAFQLIDHVAVHEQADENGHTTQTVQIKYNFVGYVS